MIRKGREFAQLNMFNGDMVFEEMIPANHWARAFRSFFANLLPKDFFDGMYHERLGRPANDPVILTAALALQEYLHLSDRELERRVRYNLEIKFALGLPAFHKGFDHSIFDAHRNRLRKHGKDKKIFALVLKHMVDSGLVKTTETMFVDATHIEPAIAIVSPVALTRRAISNVVRALDKSEQVSYQELQGIGLEDYLQHINRQEKAGRFDEGKLSEVKRAEVLQEVYTQATTLLEFVESTGIGDAAEEIAVLRTVLSQSLKKTEGGVETMKRHESQDRVVSTADPEARYGRKSKLKTFNGYKAHIAVTKQGVITATTVSPGNVADGNELPAISEQLTENELQPEIMATDSAYGWGENQEFAKTNGFELYAKPTNFKPLPEGFTYDLDKKTIVCPNGVYGKPGKEVNNKTHYSFLVENCRGCERFSTCRSKSQQKRIEISRFYSLNEAAHNRCSTEEYKATMKDRYVVERAFYGIAVASGMRKLRRWGKRNVEYTLNLISAITNILCHLRRAKAEVLPRMV